MTGYDHRSEKKKTLPDSRTKSPIGAGPGDWTFANVCVCLQHRSHNHNHTLASHQHTHLNNSKPRAHLLAGHRAASLAFAFNGVSRPKRAWGTKPINNNPSHLARARSGTTNQSTCRFRYHHCTGECWSCLRRAREYSERDVPARIRPANGCG